MARFLSAEWVEELGASAAADPELGARAAGVRLVLQQVVKMADGAEAAYALRVDGGRLELVWGRAADADVTLTEDYSTAAAMARGQLSAQAALLAGQLRVSGDTGALVRGQDALEAAQACFVRVQGSTSY